VAQGFGTKIWLCRNAEEESRELLTRVLGRWTRVIKGHAPHVRETESPVDLVPIDAWGRWSDERAAIARSNGHTYWLPLSLDVPRTPLGEPIAERDPWEEAEELAAKALLEIAAPVSDPDAPELIEDEEQSTGVESTVGRIPGLEMLEEIRLSNPPLQPSQPSHAQTTRVESSTPSEEEWL
jgi:hypothetical protein